MRSVSRALARPLVILLLPILALGLLASAPGGSHDRPDDLPLPERESVAPREGELPPEYVFKVQDVGNLAMSVSNHGFLGNNFAERISSMEYPKGTEIDHLVRAGLWIGGSNTNWDTLVTTGVQDGYWGSYTRPTEFVPVSLMPDEVLLGSIRERSTLPTSPYYDPSNAISEMDFVTSFLDTLERDHVPEQGNADTKHNPTGLIIKQESFAWSYEPADAMILYKWTMVPTITLTDAYVGLYAELTTGWKGKYPQGTWPPSSANWFHHHYLYWADDLVVGEVGADPLNMVAENNWDGDGGAAPQYAGIKFLGAKFKRHGVEWSDDHGRVAWRWWNWEPGSFTMDNDSEKYEMLSRDGIDDWTMITPSTDNSGDSPIQLINIGDWDLSAGSSGTDPDTLVVAFAFLAGDDFEDLVDNALFAQKVYNFNYTVPTPPHSPKIMFQVDQGRIRILWEGSPERSVDPVTHDFDFEGYRIYLGRSAEESSYELIKQFDIDRTPAKNPALDGYFTRGWMSEQMAIHDEYATEQDLLNGMWPGEGYLWDGDALEPFLVTEPDSVSFNTGFGSIELHRDDWVTEVSGTDTTRYRYAYTMENLSDGHEYRIAVTSFDQGTPGTPVLESGLSQNGAYVISGMSPATAAGRGVTVFPNPYRGSATWDANRASGRYIWFAGLPARAQIKIFTLAGDLVDEIDFESDLYTAENATGVNRGWEGDLPPQLSGTMAAWDLLNHNGEPVATGLYLYSVTEKGSGDSQQGKFLILK